MKRIVLGGICLISLTALILVAQQPAKREMTVVSYGGGAYQESHQNAFIKPFAARSSVKVNSTSWGAEYGRLQQMVKSGDVSWDVVEVTAAQFSRGTHENLYAPLTRAIPGTTFVPLEGGPKPTKFGAPNVYWSTVLAYQPKAFKTAPASWKDFWDVRRFPGARAMYDNPRGTLEFALLADGVPREKLYPLNVDRAFRKLDELRPHVRIWWKDGTEPVNALQTNRVVMSSAWSGRIYASASARAELRYTWAGAAHELDYWVIPRGSRNVELATRFIEFASTAAPMAQQAAATAYGPTNSLAIAAIPKPVLPHLPTAPQNWAVSFVVDADWWASHEQEVMQRWNVWRSNR